MIPPAQVQRTMCREETQFIGRCPPNVARLTARPALRLSHSALDGDDDVAQVESSAGRERKGVGSPRPRGSSRPPSVRGKCRRRQKGKGEHVGRFESAAHALVQSGQLTIVRQDQPD
jgi:hypothetical protein